MVWNIEKLKKQNQRTYDLKVKYQQLEGDLLNNLLLKMDCEYYPYEDPEVFLKMVKRHTIDVRCITFDKRFGETAEYGNWMCGRFVYSKDTPIPKWVTAYGETPELALGRLEVRIHFGDIIDTDILDVDRHLTFF